MQRGHLRTIAPRMGKKLLLHWNVINPHTDFEFEKNLQFWTMSSIKDIYSKPPEVRNRKVPYFIMINRFRLDAIGLFLLGYR